MSFLVSRVYSCIRLDLSLLCCCFQSHTCERFWRWLHTLPSAATAFDYGYPRVRSVRLISAAQLPGPPPERASINKCLRRPHHILTEAPVWPRPLSPGSAPGSSPGTPQAHFLLAPSGLLVLASAATLSATSSSPPPAHTDRFCCVPEWPRSRQSCSRYVPAC